MVWPPMVTLEPAGSGSAFAVNRRTGFVAECAMKVSWLFLLAAMLCTTVSIARLNRAIAGNSDIDLTRWTPPDISTVPDDPFGILIKYGHALFTDTANEIGPTMSDPARRFAGNNLTCQNCHLQGGTQPYAMALIGVWGQFPRYRAREGVSTL